MIVLEYRVKGLIGSLEVFSLNTNSFRPSCGYTLAITCDVSYILNTVKKESGLVLLSFCKKKVHGYKELPFLIENLSFLVSFGFIKLGI